LKNCASCSGHVDASVVCRWWVLLVGVVGAAGGCCRREATACHYTGKGSSKYAPGPQIVAATSRVRETALAGTLSWQRGGE
jgi:hypothetical protein